VAGVGVVTGVTGVCVVTGVRVVPGVGVVTGVAGGASVSGVGVVRAVRTLAVRTLAVRIGATVGSVVAASVACVVHLAKSTGCNETWCLRYMPHFPPRTPTTMTDRDRQLDKMKNADGFVAALDQSGGSTPKALGIYGIAEDAWSTEGEMFDLVHEMRTRIITSPAFTGERILAAILFENTMERQIEGQDTADYLWNVKEVVPILKVDKGLASESDGVRLMKPMPDLDELLDRAEGHGIFGTKMRSVVSQASASGIGAIVDQQFEIGRHIADRGFVPILEPEVDIHCPDKAEAERILKQAIMRGLAELDDGEQVMLKLTLPEEDNLYGDCIEHPSVVRVVALSGGYSREEANDRLSRQIGMVASFSRALSEGLSANQSDEEFNQMLDRSIQAIYEASIT